MMPRFLTVGEAVWLERPWHFELIKEKRNQAFGLHLTGSALWEQQKVTIPGGTLLVVKRVYIRAGAQADFNSVTFQVNPGLKNTKLKGRFFVRLDDVHNMRFYQ